MEGSFRIARYTKRKISSRLAHYKWYQWLKRGQSRNGNLARCVKEQQAEIYEVVDKQLEKKIRNLLKDFGKGTLILTLEVVGIAAIMLRTKMIPSILLFRTFQKIMSVGTIPNWVF